MHGRNSGSDGSSSRCSTGNKRKDWNGSETKTTSSPAPQCSRIASRRNADPPPWSPNTTKVITGSTAPPHDSLRILSLSWPINAAAYGVRAICWRWPRRWCLLWSAAGSRGGAGSASNFASSGPAVLLKLPQSTRTSRVGISACELRRTRQFARRPARP